MSESSARVLLVRHAQHKTSVGESGLTVLGERQAKALAAAIQRRPTDALVSSPMRRAMATAAAFGMTFDVVEGLQEFDFGPEAPDAATMVAERTDLTIWRAGHGFAGGETLSEFQAGVSATVAALVSGYPGERSSRSPTRVSSTLHCVGPTPWHQTPLGSPRRCFRTRPLRKSNTGHRAGEAAVPRGSLSFTESATRPTSSRSS